MSQSVNSKSALLNGVVSIKTLAAVFTLKYDFNLLCELEADHPDIMTGGLDETKLRSPLYIRKLLALGLKGPEGDDVSPDLAGKVISELGLKSAVDAIGLAILASFGFNPDGTPILQPDADTDLKN